MARKTIRLACCECDRSDFDFITASELKQAMKNGWTDVERVQTYAEACKSYPDPNSVPPGRSVFDWWSHLGWCPECGQEKEKFHGDERGKRVG
jgi:NADH pyrophosphatase NudC (nudix superfamily)